MQRIQLVEHQVGLVVGTRVAHEARRLADDAQERAEVVEVADDVVADVDLAVAGEDLHVLRFVEAAGALDGQQADADERRNGGH